MICAYCVNTESRFSRTVSFAVTWRQNRLFSNAAARFGGNEYNKVPGKQVPRAKSQGDFWRLAAYCIRKSQSVKLHA